MWIFDLFMKRRRLDLAAPRVRVTLRLGSCCAVLTPQGWRPRAAPRGFTRRGEPI